MGISGLKLRTRIALLISILISILAIAVLAYLPHRLRLAATESLQNASGSLAEIAAFGLAEALEEGRPVETAPILRALQQQHQDLVYIVILDSSGATVAAFNERLAERAESAAIRMEAIPGAETGPVHAPRASSPLENTIPRNGTRGGFSPSEPIYQVEAPVLGRGRRIGTVRLGFTLQRIAHEVARGRQTALMLGAVILTLGIAGSFLLASLIAAPIGRIARASERIASGARGERALVSGTDEVGQLAESFNEMVEKLETAHSQLETVNESLEARVQDRTRKLREEVEERTRAESALRSSEEKYRLLVERNLAGVYTARLDGTVISANLACARILGFETVEEFLTGGQISYGDEAQRERFLATIQKEQTVTNFEVELTSRAGHKVWALANARAVPNEDLVEAVLLDISDRKRAEMEVEYRAYHDPLTGLPNRHLLRDRLDIALAQARRRERSVGVLFLDIDNLKGVNDTLGHEIGDQVLQMVGDRLLAVLRDEDTVARIGGDEFAIVLPDLETGDEVARVAEKILEALQPPLSLGEEEIRVTASIGAAVYPRDGQDAEGLLRNADRTMYRVKEKGGKGVRFFDLDDVSRGLRRSSLEDELRKGIERGEFVPYYQPQYDLETRALVGAEALVRWHHPEGIVVPPAGFISLAEYTGLIIPLGELVLRRSCIDLQRWQAAGATALRLGINISARQFHQRDLIGVLTSALESSGADPTRIELEVTESLAVQKSGWTIRLLEKIREMGMRIAVDDFGTGQSSLMYLKSFPVDTVKIDREFVRGMTSNPHDQSIVIAILLLASSLGLRTVAEGIETEEDCRFLSAHGCEQGQGFLFSHAVPRDEFEALLFSKSEPATATRGSGV